MKRSITFQKITLFYAIVALGLLFYFKYVVNPALYFAAQEPIFYGDRFFLKEFLSHPGGLLEYAAALLSQFYYWPWFGSLTILVVFVLIFLLLSNVFTRLLERPHFFVAALPVAILFYAHHSYVHLFVVDMALLIALAGLALYASLKTNAAKLFFVLLIGPVFYYAAGSAFFVFALYVMFYELVTTRHIVSLVFLLVYSIVLPFIAQTILFVRLTDAFYAPAFPDARLVSLNTLLYLSVPVLVILTLAIKKINLKIFQKPQLTFWMHSVVVLAIFCLIPILNQKKSDKVFYDIIYRSRIGDWQAILKRGENPYPNSPQVTSIINRALYHTGQLGEKLFAYPQDFGLGGLFVLDDAHLSSPLIRSDLYFELGHFNEAKHWAYEAVSVTGETVWNLQRLVVVLLMYEQNDAAAIYLRKLNNSIIAKKWAKRFMPYATGEANLRDDPDIGPLLAFKVRDNFLSFINNPVPDLYELLQANSQNKMATAYLLASLLLNKKLEQFANLIQQYGHGQDVPRHYQEALIFYASQTPEAPVAIRRFINQQTAHDFQAFQKSFQANRQNRNAMRNALAVRFADTYWYYLLFHQGRDS